MTTMTMTETAAPAPIPGERTLLIVEDDKSFLTRLARAMEARGFEVATAESVADDGPGFSPEVMDTLGEPYVTTRPSGQRANGTQTEGSGLGLGFFIAKTLLERSGARVTVSNRPGPGTGAAVRVAWPRGDFNLPSYAAADGLLEVTSA